MFRIAALAAAMAATPAFANDTMAELTTGGLVFTRTEAVMIDSEDLYISPDAVRVEYVFRNVTDKDVESIVAFPMPDITYSPDSEVAMPEPGRDNFLGFTVTAGGTEITPELQQRAIVAGIDVTEDLNSAGIPVNPFVDGGFDAIGELPERIAADWISRGLLYDWSYDDGSGWKTEYYPRWTLRSTYWWRMNFPAGEAVQVSHAYRPSVGGTTGVSFYYDGEIGGDHYPAMKDKYCIDGSFERAVINAGKSDPGGYPPYMENWISYVLTTGANWAYSIGEFTLTVDKGSPQNLVSFCGTGVEKIGPTTFQLTYTDFVPQKEIDILLLRRFDR